VGTAVLTGMSTSLEKLLKRLHIEGYSVCDSATDPDALGQSLVVALVILGESPVILVGSSIGWVQLLKREWNMQGMELRH